LKLPKVGFVKVKQHRHIPDHYILKSVTVSQTPSGKYYASVLFEYEHIVLPVEVNTAVGLDYSMAELFVDSGGGIPEYPRYYRRKLAKLARAQRKLSKMVMFSSNWYKQKRKVAILHEKIANQRKDFLHKQSRQIANAYDLVGVEDLNMRAMSQSLNFGKSVHDNGWGMFRVLLEYKLEEQGKHFVKIDKFFPSSRKCSAPDCSYVNKALELSDREWVCPECGVTHDRDVNAAINIRNEAVRLYNERNLVTATV
jgi:putative transposase